MPEADDSAQLAEDILSALDEYASVYREAIRIAADGAPGNEVADLSLACWDGAVALRLVEADEVGFAAGAPASAGVLVRELYESFVVLSGVERVAHILSLPLSTCANGETLAPFVQPDGEVARWSSELSGRPFAPQAVPRSLIRVNRRDSSSTVAYLSWARPRLAATADRDAAGGEDLSDLDAVFAGRLGEAIGVYSETVTRARAEGSNSAQVDDLLARLTTSARRAAPALIGFARLADRDEGNLRPPPEASAVARLLADGFVALAAAQSSEDLATLPYPDPSVVASAATPLREWFESQPRE